MPVGAIVDPPMAPVNSVASPWPGMAALREGDGASAGWVPGDVRAPNSSSAPIPGKVPMAGELAGGEYSLAALVMPATVEHIRQISLGGERMPSKSTYFYPKLLSGLVFNPLE